MDPTDLRAETLPPELYVPAQPAVQRAAESCRAAGRRLQRALEEVTEIQGQWSALESFHQDLAPRPAGGRSRTHGLRNRLDTRLEELRLGVHRLRRLVLRVFEEDAFEAARRYREALRGAAEAYATQLMARKAAVLAELSARPESERELADQAVRIEVAAGLCQVYATPHDLVELRGRPRGVIEQALNPELGTAFPVGRVLELMEPSLAAEAEGGELLVSLKCWQTGTRTGEIEVEEVWRRSPLPQLGSEQEDVEVLQSMRAPAMAS